MLKTNKEVKELQININKTGLTKKGRQTLEEQTQGQTMTRNNIMLVQLHCGGYSIGLQLPASPADVQQKLDTLRNGSEQNAPISIRDVNEPLSYLRQYIQNVDLTSGPELEKLNRLSEKVDGMSAQEQHILWGALDAEGIDGLDDVLSIASSLGQYQFVEGVTSYKQLGGWLVEHGLARVDFPEEVRPYLNYEGIGLEYGDSHGGSFTPYGYVKRWEEVQTQKAEDRPSFALTLVSAAGAVHLDLPASDDQMEAAKRALRLDSLDSAVIGDVKIDYAWSHLLPMDSITLKDANTLAECVRQMTQQELRAFGAALEVEGPRSFYDAGCIAMDRDDYELVTSNEAEYGREALRYAGAGDEILEILDGFTDFDALGRSEMETDGVRETSFGSVRRLSAPWPRHEPAQPEPERGMTMGTSL